MQIIHTIMRLIHVSGGQAREGNGRECSLAHTRLKVWTSGVKNITNWHQTRHQNLQPWLHFALKIVSVTQSTKRSTEGTLAREPEKIRSDIISQRDREGTYSKLKETERNMRGRERKIHISITARRHWFRWIIVELYINYHSGAMQHKTTEDLLINVIIS